MELKTIVMVDGKRISELTREELEYHVDILARQVGDLREENASLRIDYVNLSKRANQHLTSAMSL